MNSSVLPAYVCQLPKQRRRQTLRWLACGAVLVSVVQWADTSSASASAWVNGAPTKRTTSSLLFTDRAQRLTREHRPGGLFREKHDTPPTLGAAATDIIEASADDRSGLVFLWGALGVAAYLSYGIAKVVPIVSAGLVLVETPLHWAFLAGTILFFAYYEGYKGFQKGFSPRVVSRAWVVSQKVRSEVLDKELLRRYGIAYLLTSILFSVSLFPSCFYLMKNGVDMTSLLTRFGMQNSAAAGNLSTAALTYALWKACSPLVFALTETITPLVARIMGVSEAKVEKSIRTPLLHKILAPFFSMGYFHGSRKRVISSWALTAGLALVIVGVKKLANPYRAIVDAGVIVGLSWGVISILFNLARSLITGRPPSIDPGLPEQTVYIA